MKLSCTTCSKNIEIIDDVIHQIYRKKLLCNQCGAVIHIKSYLLDDKDLNAFSCGDALKQEVVNNLQKLYPMPHILFKARNLIAGEANFEELEKLLSTDTAMAGRVLKIANSAYYGMRGKVSSIKMAATVLGTDTLLQIFTLLGHSKVLGRAMEGYGKESGDLWKHSLAVAICARLIEETIHSGNGDDAFLAGLMHDAGKIILEDYVLERKALFTRYCELTRAPISEAEDHILEFSHADIGFELCLKWDLPDAMATAIKTHHSPSDSGGNRLAYVLNLANHMAKELTPACNETSHPPVDALKFLPISEIGLKELLRTAAEEFEILEEVTY